MWGTIICCIISSIVSVLLSDKIIQGINTVFIKLGLSKNGDISGVWKATFEMGKGSKKAEYVEIIKLSNRLGIVWGRIEPNELNYPMLQSYMKQKPLRVKGTLTDNRFFTGYWYHPIESYRFHGSFQLLIDGSMMKMTGQWIGYSTSGKEIDNGTWIWEKIDTSSHK